MTAQAKSVYVKTYPVPASKKFTLKMHPERTILGLVNNAASGFSFLVEEPDGTDQQDFSFCTVALNEKFSKPQSWSYLGETLVVVDPTADRPSAETRYVYGERFGRATGGAA